MYTDAQLRDQIVLRMHDLLYTPSTEKRVKTMMDTCMDYLKEVHGYRNYLDVHNRYQAIRREKHG